MFTCEVCTSYQVPDLFICGPHALVIGNSVLCQNCAPHGHGKLKLGNIVNWPDMTHWVPQFHSYEIFLKYKWAPRSELQLVSKTPAFIAIRDHTQLVNQTTGTDPDEWRPHRSGFTIR